MLPHRLGTFWRRDESLNVMLLVLVEKEEGQLAAGSLNNVPVSSFSCRRQQQQQLWNSTSAAVFVFCNQLIFVAGLLSNKHHPCMNGRKRF